MHADALYYDTLAPVITKADDNLQKGSVRTTSLVERHTAKHQMVNPVLRASPREVRVHFMIVQMFSEI